MLKKLKDNKSGFSLVELICAVLILGAVCGPLVWSFVASSNMSRTAVEISRATLAAENIIQTIDARPVTNFAQCSALDDFPQLTDAQKELLTEMFGSDQSVTLTTLTSNDGTNTKIGEDGSFQLAVQGLKTGSTEYDALVSFTRGDPNEPDPNDPDPPPVHMVSMKSTARMLPNTRIWMLYFHSPSPRKQIPISVPTLKSEH